MGEGAPSRRIAGQAPVNMGELDVQKIQSEQTVIVAGYGAFVVNNTPRNPAFFMPKEGVGRGVIIGPLGSNPKFQPYGIQKFEWNPEIRQLEQAWVNETISSPNGVPWVSIGSGQVYFMGARDNEWTLEAVNWLTGEPTLAPDRRSWHGGGHTPEGQHRTVLTTARTEYVAVQRPSRRQTKQFGELAAAAPLLACMQTSACRQAGTTPPAHELAESAGSRTGTPLRTRLHALIAILWCTRK